MSVRYTQIRISPHGVEVDVDDLDYDCTLTGEQLDRLSRVITTRGAVTGIAALDDAIDSVWEGCANVYGEQRGDVEVVTSNGLTADANASLARWFDLDLGREWAVWAVAPDRDVAFDLAAKWIVKGTSK